MPSQTFGATGWHSFDVPKDVERITVTVTGGSSRNQGGGRVIGDIFPVNDTQTLQCFVGGRGLNANVNTGAGGAGGTGGGARGGDGGQGFDGGDGGGGASYIRINTHTGTLKVVAGGAGGQSGDNGAGGDGGGPVGGQGHRSTSAFVPTGVATGGTQNQGGNGGTSSAGATYNGSDADNGVLGDGGRGGAATTRSHGGGGGGGGYHGGGGGPASLAGYAPGGGGGGGASYIGGLVNVQTNTQGTNVGNGEITLSWVTPAAKNNPPTPPSNVTLNKVAVSDDMHTKITGSPTVSGIVNDPDNEDTIRLVVRWSTQENFSDAKGPRYSDNTKPYTKRGERAEVDLPDLAQNTRYWVRVSCEDDQGANSTNYTGFSFWTNQAALPDHLTVNGGGSGVTIQSVDSAIFGWQFNDPNEADLQQGFHLRWRITATATTPPGGWSDLVKDNSADNMSPGAGPPSHSRNQWVFDPGRFKGNTYYEWQVRTRDQQGLWSDWSIESFKFFAASTSSPPILVAPMGAIAVDVTKPITFQWKFMDPDPGDTQFRADIRWQVVDQSLPEGIANPDEDDDTVWTTVLGDTTTPGSVKQWTFPPNTFPFQTTGSGGGYLYRWEVRTYDSAGNVSDWSSSARFWTMATPGSAAGPDPIPELATAQGSLGCGEYRVFIYEQGGQRILGEIHAIAAMQFSRVRDDISVCTLSTNGLGDADCCEFYSGIRSWMHELVVFRDGIRVWEGPITRITYTTTDVEFEARDVMVYVYRRIMRQGYNDTYRITERNPNGSVQSDAGVFPVIERAQIIIANALAPHDPNVLPYLTAITAVGDALQTNSRPDWATTAWEEVDSLAATAGLDYTVVGRRILLWDTHTPIGRLPTMTDGDFSDSPIVSEYGMQTATYLAVTNGSGVAGGVSVKNADRPKNTPANYPYGPVEMLASSYSASATAPAQAVTQKALEKMIDSLVDQAKRNIAGRFPNPLIVRVPDNSSLSPECAVGFQQLIPGVWIPLRASGTCRVVTQWQKLDSVTVNVDESGEQVQVVMSPAPRGGMDPDADDAAAEE